MIEAPSAGLLALTPVLGVGAPAPPEAGTKTVMLNVCDALTAPLLMVTVTVNTESAAGAKVCVTERRAPLAEPSPKSQAGTSVAGAAVALKEIAIPVLEGLGEAETFVRLGAIVSVSAALPVPPGLVALTVTLNWPMTLGAPEISPAACQPSNPRANPWRCSSWGCYWPRSGN